MLNVVFTYDATATAASNSAAAPAGEDIVQAAEREVLEETGVRAPFSALLAIRQAHGFAFGKSDMFFCCGLIPEPGQTQLTACVSYCRCGCMGGRADNKQ